MPLAVMVGLNLMLSIGSACRNLKRPHHSIRSGQSDDISGVSESVEEQIWVGKRFGPLCAMNRH